MEFFPEAGHGKGPADDIGGAYNRAEDMYVANGGSITVQSLSCLIFRENQSRNVWNSGIRHNHYLESHLSAVPRTMKLHQGCQSEHLKFYI